MRKILYRKYVSLKMFFQVKKTAVHVLHQFYIKSFDVRAICDMN